MFTNHGNVSCNRLLLGSRWAAASGLFLFLMCIHLHAYAQGNFNSGSTGADGAFAPSASPTPVQVPPSGVFNFTTINIPAGVSVTFIRNAKNAPVTMLAQGNVTIAGSLLLDGEVGGSHRGGGGGVGGFNGGIGGLRLADYTSGTTGDGPGGGGGARCTVNCGDYGAGGSAGYAVAGADGGGGSSTTRGAGGPRYGTSTLQPLVGGSGGGGTGRANSNCDGQGGSGGGGGGAIIIASSTTITFSGAIAARGGNGSNQTGCGGGGGGGAGGAIRLVANAITGSGQLYVTGGNGGSGLGYGGGNGAFGFIRIEAFDLSGSNITVFPNDSSAISIVQPKPAILPNAPQLLIASVAGVAAPATPTGSLTGVPDIVIPTIQTAPVNVVIQGANLPVGTAVQVTLTPENGPRTTVSGTLTGTQTSSTTTVSLTLPTSGQSVISATATIDLLIARASPIFINGERVDRLEVAATFGGTSEITYITHSGKRIKRSD